MASIKEVAALAGVSPATVSRVMNGTARVDPEKRERVLQAIEETGFVPNEAARTLFRKSARTIGLIVPSIRNPYFTELAALVDAKASEAGFRPFLCCTDYDYDKEKAAVQMLVSMNADAVILASCSEQIRQTLGECPVPVVALDAMLSGAEVRACIYCDYYRGGRMAAEYLLDRGCRHPVCIKAPQTRYGAKNRFRGYADVCRERGVEVRSIECRYDFREGLQATEELLRQFPEADGIVASSDMVAFSAYKVLREHGIAVPEQVQLIGFDDISLAALMTPELTTVRQPMEEMVAKAVALCVSGKDPAEREFVFPVSVVPRQTTK